MLDEPRSLIVALPLPDRRLCGNGAAPASKAGNIARNKRIREQREAAYWRGLDAVARLPLHVVGPGKPYFPAGTRVRVDILVKRDPTWAARRLDDDNLIRGMKSQIDGLTDCRCVWADDRQVQWGTITWETADSMRGRVELTLTAINPQQD